MAKKKDGSANGHKVRTHLIRGTFHSRCWDYDHHIIPPMSASAAYRLDSVNRGAQGFSQFGSDQADEEIPIYIYDRLGEPTRGMLEENLAFSEGGEMAICFASGMAAISAALAVTTRAGDEIVAHHTLYGCTYSLLTHWMPRSNIVTRFADLQNGDGLIDAITDNTRVVYVETPVNPTLALIDLAAIRQEIDKINANRAAGNKIVLIVDNTFATPYCQQPLALGADLVVHSLTKNIGGFGTDMGGAVIGARRYQKDLLIYRKDFGGVLSPRNAWPILVYGLPTLAARTVNQQKTALKVARFLESHPKVERVYYPGLESFPQYELAKRQMISHDGKFAPGSILYFVLKGDVQPAKEAAERFIDHIAQNAYSITLAVSLGQIRTLIEEPFSMTHASLPDDEKIKHGVYPGGIRLSIGLEDWHDIIEDLRIALTNS
ncbi:MAG: aminotransferase class I/II-fold pyridoxal phosphate-dependent enzyme [Cyanobacteria bacterium]|nr:aminotransferase class I/II-fold pyridoxal phosphate-dependent enzyme [Cyanobacteriota bacterium]